MEDILINGKNAWSQWRIRLMVGSLEQLLKPAPAKPFVINESRDIPGRQVLPKKPQPKQREITLDVSIQGDDFNDYVLKLDSFFDELRKGIVELYIPLLDRTYRLVYVDSFLKKRVASNGFGTFKIDFEEPDPTNRGNE